MVELARRSFITGLIALVAAPAIVRAGSLMPVRQMQPESLEDLVAMLSRRIDVAERVMANNLLQSLYGDLAPSGELFGTVMNRDLNRLGDRSGAPVLRWHTQKTIAGIPLHG